MFRTEGIRVLTTPDRTPVTNAFAERSIGTLRRELLDRTTIWNQRQLHRLVTENVEHDNAHRPHRALQKRAPTAPADHELASPPPTAEIIHLPRCDGLINEYKTAA